MIHFYSCRNLEETEAFYKRFPLKVYMRQPNTIIYDSGEGMIGFVQMNHEKPAYSCISFVVKDEKAVDDYYQELQDLALDKPMKHPWAPVYSFFIEDPNGYKLEFQAFI